MLRLILTFLDTSFLRKLLLFFPKQGCVPVNVPTLWAYPGAQVNVTFTMPPMGVQPTPTASAPPVQTPPTQQVLLKNFFTISLTSLQSETNHPKTLNLSGRQDFSCLLGWRSFKVFIDAETAPDFFRFVRLNDKMKVVVYFVGTAESLKRVVLPCDRRVQALPPVTVIPGDYAKNTVFATVRRLLLHHENILLVSGEPEYATLAAYSPGNNVKCVRWDSETCFKDLQDFGFSTTTDIKERVPFTIVPFFVDQMFALDSRNI